MSYRYPIGLATSLALVTLAGGQTPPPGVSPGTTPPNSGTQTQPIVPKPTGGAKINPSPTGATNLYPPTLYRMNDVGKSLNLTQEQLTRVNAATDKVQQQYRDQFGSLSTLNDAERFARQQELNRLYAADWNKATADVFNADQRLRYQQLTQQYGGFNTLYDPEVQKRLNLTPEQVKNLRANVDWSTGQYTTLTAPGDVDAARRAAQYAEYRKQYEDRFNRLLTPEQQKTWREMTGEPYTFQPPFPPR